MIEAVLRLAQPKGQGSKARSNVQQGSRIEGEAQGDVSRLIQRKPARTSALLAPLDARRETGWPKAMRRLARVCNYAFHKPLGLTGTDAELAASIATIWVSLNFDFRMTAPD